MSTVKPDELKKILKVVEAASQNHTNWYEELIRRLLCHLPLPDSVTAVDAHRRCAFGSWFYGIGQGSVQELEALRSIGELHETMHNRAREVCLKIRAVGYAPEPDYDRFVQDLGQFRNALAQFRDKVVNTLHGAGTARHP